MDNISANATVDRNIYGARESNGLVNGQEYHRQRNEDGPPEKVDWTTRGLRITRLRLLGDPGCNFLDVSYCHGTLDGQHVDVQLPFSQLPSKGRNRAIVQHAARDGVYAKGLGIFEAISTLV